MIKVNLAVKKESFKVPVVLGIDLAQVNWVVLLLIFAFYNFVPGLFQSFWQSQREEADQELIQKNQTLRKINQEINSYGDLKAQLEAYNKQVENLKERTAQVEQIIQRRTNPHYLLEKIARSTPIGVWFDRLEVSNEATLTVEGRAREYRLLQDLINNLNDSPFFTDKVNLSQSQTVTEKEGDEEVRLESFTLKGGIKVFDPYNN